MRLAIQTVNFAKVIFEDGTSESIEKGLLVYLGVHKEDTEKDIDECVRKIKNLRIFNDENGKVNLSITDLGYSVMVISNFSLYGDFKKGNRPSFTESANAELANSIYEKFLSKLETENIPFAKGRFQTYMRVLSENDGPMNLIYETKR